MRLTIILLSIILPFVIYPSAQLKTEILSKMYLFPKTKIDIGMIRTTSKQLQVKFDYENLTGETIIINRVKVSCGCLSVNYPKHPIKKNEQGQIEITFDPKGYIGHFQKSVIVYSKGFKPIVLTFKGFINEKN